MSDKTIEGEHIPNDIGGRPTKYTPQLCDEILALFDKGWSITRVCRHLRISRKTFHNWCARYPEFKEAAEKGVTWAEAAKEEELDDYGSGRKKCGSAQLVKFQFEHQFGWNKEKAAGNTIHIENLQINQLSKDELEQQTKLLMKELGLLKIDDNGK